MTAIYNRTNAMVTDLGDNRYRVEKAGGVANMFDASAASTSAIAGDFVLRASAPSDATSVMVGVTVDPAESDDGAALDRAIHIAGGEMTVHEEGIVQTAGVAHGGAVWIARTGTTLTYRSGATYPGSIVRRTVTGVAGPLYFDSSIATFGGVVDVRFDPPGAWTGAGTGARAARGRTHLAMHLGL